MGLVSSRHLEPMGSRTYLVLRRHQGGFAEQVSKGFIATGDRMRG